MYSHETFIRVIYADTDNMGVVYYANYLKWFEIGRTELFRALGVSYKAIEENGFSLPVAEVNCKYRSPARYDDVLGIQTAIDPSVKAGIKFDYVVSHKDSGKVLATGFTRHPYVDRTGKVVRPPALITDLLKNLEKGGSKKP